MTMDEKKGRILSIETLYRRALIDNAESKQLANVIKDLMQLQYYSMRPADISELARDDDKPQAIARYQDGACFIPHEGSNHIFLHEDGKTIGYYVILRTFGEWYKKKRK